MSVRAETQIDLARVDDGSPGTPGQNGATFTPSVAVDGDISWTNDGGLPNPPTQNIMGPQGSPGTPGANGVSVTSVEPQYYLSTSDSSATGGSWSSTPAAFVSGRYYWTRDYITFSDGSNDTSTEVYNAGMTKAAQDAYDAKTLADDTNQYFWYAPTGADTGAHITEVPQDEWNDSSDPNYHSGGNLLARSNGIAVRDGLTELATFGANGITLGEYTFDKSQLYASPDGIKLGRRIVGSDGIVLDFSYEDYWSFVIGRVGRPADAWEYDPDVNYYVGDYCTHNDKRYVCIEDTNPPEAWTASHWKRTPGRLSVAESGSTAHGDYAHSEGLHSQAFGDNSHAEGSQCEARGYNSHAEGGHTATHNSWGASIAYGDCSHAEGVSRARGDYSHAEGALTVAEGDFSHAQNFYTEAGADYQTVIGKYNDNQPDTAFEIGNGTHLGDFSNALTVDWNGNLKASGSITDGSNNVLSNKANGAIRAGGFSATTVSANSYNDVPITFSSPMPNVPIVVCSIISTSTAGAIGSISVSPNDITKTGFTARIFNAGSSARTPALSYIAYSAP